MKVQLFILLFTIILPLSTFAQGRAEADVSLTPAGDFKAKVVEVKGFATVNGNTVIAENVVVNLKNLKTGLALRDKHAREKYLEVDKYPEIILLKAIGKAGKGRGRVKYRGVEKDIAGTYAVKGNVLQAQFPLNLSDFNIKGVKYMGVGVENEVKINVEIPVKK